MKIWESDFRSLDNDIDDLCFEIYVGGEECEDMTEVSVSFCLQNKKRLPDTSIS